MAKQVFGHTLPTPVDGYASYVMAFVREDGWIVVAVRDKSGVHTETAISPLAAAELASVISTAVFPHLPTARKE